MEWMSDPAIWIGLATLIVLEIVLGIDNLVFIAILADKLPPHQRDKARLIGLSLALFMRLALLSVLSWLVGLTEPLFSLGSLSFSGRDLILLAGGLFLIFKATTELHERLEGSKHHTTTKLVYSSFGVVVTQIVLIDAVFSLDSVITAIGMVDNLGVMVAAVVVAMAVMLLASKPLTRFVNAHPTVIVLCLSFLLMIGFSLVAEGFGFHMPKGYLYAAIGFSVMIESMNQWAQRNRMRHESRIPLRERSAASIFKMLGGQPGTARPAAEPAGDTSAAPVFAPEERNMVSGVLSLAGRSIHTVMTPRADIQWIDLQDSPDALRAQLVATPHGVLPVCRGALDQLVGFAYARDLLAALVTHGHIDEAAGIRQPLVVPASVSVIGMVEMLRQSRSPMALVTDEYGTILGLVTRIDVLEAIAGDFPDEGERADIEAQQAEGHWIADGLATLPAVEQATGTAGLAGAAGGASTLAGYLLARHGALPVPGTTVQVEGLRFEVLEMQGRRIARVDIRRQPESASGTQGAAA